MNNLIPSIIGQVSRVLSQAGFVNQAARHRWRMQYEFAPILLKNGIADSYPEKVMSILQLTQQNGYPLDDGGYFGYFSFTNGGTFMQNTVAQYPFANQYTAANAIVRQPNNISLLMTCPARSNMPIDKRQSIFQSLMASLDRHIALGGMFVVYTPMAIMQNCLLLAVRDSSSGENAVLQNGMIFDFTQPQIMTDEDAQKATNATMDKINKGEKF
ncbi:hypothetical protein UFOVP136_44 [uncultured Caudovirales phage]|uniref:Uncharacterized protein n=1 Tax=uncultured Caudovirales phage TaxID=2100421 RepID=A0A6J5LDQ8_9CAUD|nr:hypothetical protein UFOVP136_44 [uncultured Caudovirales phage]